QHDRERKRFGLQRHGGSRRPNRIAAGRVYRGARVVDHRTAGGRDRRIPQEGFVMRPFSPALATLLGAGLIGGCPVGPPQPPPAAYIGALALWIIVPLAAAIVAFRRRAL